MSPTGSDSPNHIEQALRETLGDDTASPQSAAPQPKKRPVKLIAAILSTALVLILGGAAFAYFTFANSPEKALADALNYAATNPGSYVYTTDDMKVTARMKNNLYYAKLEPKDDAPLEAIVSAGTIYIHSDDLTKLLTGVTGTTLPKSTESAVKAVADSVKGGWVSMSLQSPALHLDEVDNMNCLTTAKTIYQHDDKALKQTTEAYLANQFLTVTGVAGAPSGTYSIGINDGGLRAFLSNLTTKSFYKSLTDCPQQLTVPDGVKLVNYKIQVSLDKDHRLQSAAVTDAAGKKSTVSASYGNIADITPPANAVDVNVLLTQFLSSFLQVPGDDKAAQLFQ